MDAPLTGVRLTPNGARAGLMTGSPPTVRQGAALRKGSVHGFDLTFAAPKSVSLLRVLTDDIGEKAMQAAHQRAITAAMSYLHQHAGYTRVHNPLTGAKDLQRLPGLVAIAYQHETSRCGDPHLHTHVIVPNRQARADGALVSIDSKSLYHEAKAAGVDLSGHAAPRAARRAGPGMGCGGPVDRDGRDRRRHQATASGRGRGAPPSCGNGPHHNLVVVEGQLSAQQLAAAQKATRPAKPESNVAGPSSKRSGAPMRAVCTWTAPRIDARAPRAAPPRASRLTARGWRAVGADRQGRVHPRRPGGAGRRAAAGGRAGGSARAASSRSWTPSGCASARRAPRITAKATSCSPSRRSSPKKQRIFELVDAAR